MRKGQKTLLEVRLKQSVAASGKRNHNYGKKISLEHKAILSKSNMGNKNALGYRHSTEAREKIKESSTGRKHTEQAKLKISQSHREELSYLWSDDDVGYFGVHKWVYRQAGKSSKCEFADETCKGRFEWSNISSEYKRDLKDWQQLCSSHHKRYDKELRDAN